MGSNNTIAPGEFPFGDFINYLRAEGFQVDIDTHLNVSRVFQNLDDQATLSNVKTIMGALICRSEEEQELFYSMFDAYVLSQQKAPVVVNPPVDPGLASKKRAFRIQVTTAFVAIALAGVVMLMNYFRSSEPEIAAGSDISTAAPKIDSTTLSKDTTSADSIPSEQLSTPEPVFIPQIPLPDYDIDLKANIVTPSVWVTHFIFLRPYFAVFVFLLFGLYELSLVFRKRMLIKNKLQKSPPYIWKVDMEEHIPVRMSDSFYLASTRLRQRVKTGHLVLDAWQTVCSSIRNGGMLSLRYRQRTTQPEYLVLIDECNENNQYSDYFTYLARRFKKNDLHVELYYYRNDLQVCWNETRTQSTTIQQLCHSYSQHRLIIFGDGYRLTNPIRPTLLEWATIFENWKEKVIITSNPPSRWHVTEYILAEHFVVLPATDAGLRGLVEYFDFGSQSELKEWKATYRPLEPTQEGTPEEEFKQIDQIFKRESLSDDLIYWLCACSIYPELNWSLTLFIGKCLSTPQNNLLTQGNLSVLVGLPWFREGRIPDEHKTYLLKQLDRFDKGKRKEIAKAIVDLMKKHPPQKNIYQNSFAYDDYMLKLITTELMMEEGGKQDRERIDKLKDLDPARRSGYFNVLSFMDRKSVGQFDFVLPSGLRKYFFRGTFPFSRPRQYLRHMIALTIIIVPFLMSLTPYDCDGVVKIHEGQAYCIRTTEDSLKFEAIVDPQRQFLVPQDSSDRMGLLAQYNSAVLQYDKEDYAGAYIAFSRVLSQQGDTSLSIRQALDDSISYYSRLGGFLSQLYSNDFRTFADFMDFLNKSIANPAFHQFSIDAHKKIKSFIESISREDVRHKLLASMPDLSKTPDTSLVASPEDNNLSFERPVKPVLISGTAYVDGSPVSGVRISLYSAGGTSMITYTDSSGYFRFKASWPFRGLRFKLRFDGGGIKSEVMNIRASGKHLSVNLSRIENSSEGSSTTPSVPDTTVDSKKSRQEPPPREVEKRFALVIGNRYSGNDDLPPLAFSHHDAQAVARTLEQLNFKVTLGLDLDILKMRLLFKQFVNDVSENSVIMIYFSGHAVRFENDCYMVSNEASFTTRATNSVELKNQSVSLKSFLEELTRNANPKFIIGAFEISQGLIDIPGGYKRNNPSIEFESNLYDSVALLFCSSGDQVSFESKELGLFTETLIEGMKKPNQNIRDLFNEVTRGVQTRTESKQVPNIFLVSTTPFIFNPVEN